eukprot:TRINITY_DN13873_c0_g1_i1.p1 TRINITY_DN13873_c0_g1~~TRINITY_DN13873_c0_g1_i1.p1  ORF type:complete len:346 (-),score=55.72 TRINITY_DN13873_c0_g1_i1:492-1529(-)
MPEKDKKEISGAGTEKLASHRDVRCQEAEMAVPEAFTVGYALNKKKLKSFIQPTLLKQAREKGVHLIEIDQGVPLIQQGPFDAILHKLLTKEWHEELQAFQTEHPDSIVIDSPDAIGRLHNRQSMLKDVANLNLTSSEGQVGVPKQLVVEGDPASIRSCVAESGLKLPLVAKPLVSDGSAKSHDMSLALDEVCLSELRPPLVLQEFVNHGGVLFKLYVVGDAVKVVTRVSLPDVREGEGGNGVISFARISSAESSKKISGPREALEPPPEKLLASLATELRGRLGLNLFNLDIIREGGIGNRYYVIDINYFPGYAKMPDYERVFTDFLVGLAQDKRKRLTATGGE